MTTNTKKQQREARRARIRSRITGTAERPRLAVFKSNTALYAQLIDDTKGHTLATADTRTLKGKSGMERAKELGTQVAEQAKKAKIESVVFDRGGYPYQGVVATFADSAREGGLSF